MSAPAIEGLKTPELTPAEAATAELRQLLGLTHDQSIMEVTPLNRRNYDRDGRLLPGGALQIKVTIGEAATGLVSRIFEVDDDRRPLSEESVRFYGAQAVKSAAKGDIVYRTVL